MKSAIRWALKWRAKNRLDGITEHFIYEGCIPCLFETRQEARAYADKHYGYIRTRLDLQTEPHGWKMPIAVRAQLVELRRRHASRRGGQRT